MRFSKIREHASSFRSGELVCHTSQGGNGEYYCLIFVKKTMVLGYYNAIEVPCGTPLIFLERIKRKITEDTKRDHFSKVLFGDKIVFVPTRNLTHYETVDE